MISIFLFCLFFIAQPSFLTFQDFERTHGCPIERLFIAKLLGVSYTNPCLVDLLDVKSWVRCSLFRQVSGYPIFHLLILVLDFCSVIIVCSAWAFRFNSRNLAVSPIAFCLPTHHDYSAGLIPGSNLLQVCTDVERDVLLAKIKEFLTTLKKQQYGKHIVMRIEKLLNNAATWVAQVQYFRFLYTCTFLTASQHEPMTCCHALYL